MIHISLRQYWSLLRTYLRPQRWKVAALAALLLSGIALQLINPQIVRYYIDSAVTNSSLSILVTAALAYLGLVCFQQIVAITSKYIGENLGWTATNALRADLTEHCLQLDISFHKNHPPGELIERIDGDVTTLANFFSQFFILILGNMLLMVGVLVALFFEDWRIGLVLTLYACATILVLSRVRDIAMQPWLTARQASAALFSFLEERLISIEDIRTSRAEGYILRRLYSLMRDLLERTRLARLRSTLIFVSLHSLYVLGYAAALAMGAYLFSRGSTTIGTVYLIVNYTNILYVPLDQLRTQLQDLQRASASIQRIAELRAIQPSILDGPGVLFPRGPLAVAFEHVSFGYNPPELVLNDLSFRLEQGTTLGLLGRTGSGKSTITRLLTRLYEPSTGVIRLGDVDIRQSRLADLRNCIGIITQEVQLFHATIRDNLTLFDDRISDAQIVAAIKALELTAWYRGLPAGLDSMLDPSQIGLSAGEAQLLAFVRILLKDHGLVILDEASSRLDPATERRFEQAVTTLLHNRTGIIIAHRLSSIQRVDQIMILEDGYICEFGPRKQLERTPDSHFYRLLQTGLSEEFV